MTPYNVHQQVFGLAMASNAVGNLKGTQDDLQSLLQEALPPILRQIGPGWQVVWGPTVWKSSPADASTGPDNAWYVAHNPSVAFEDGGVHELFVVAVAGTATSYDWIKEDFDVAKVVDFPAWIAQWGGGLPTPPVEADVGTITPGGTYIARGTAKATYTLISERPPAGAQGARISLPEFLRVVQSNAQPGNPVKIVFTGHSLGGALAPTTGLALVQGQFVDASLALAYPLAGPTPGNGNFMQLFASKFPKHSTSASEYQTWNCNIANKLDIVPQAWCTNPILSPEQHIGNIPGIYGPLKGLVSIFVRLVVGQLTQMANKSMVTYMPLCGSFFSGTPPKTPTTTSEFMATVRKQHVTSYFELFGIPYPRPSEEMVLARSSITFMTTEEEISTYVVLNTFMEGISQMPSDPAAIEV